MYFCQQTLCLNRFVLHFALFGSCNSTLSSDSLAHGLSWYFSWWQSCTWATTMTLSVHGPSCTGRIHLWFFSPQVSVVKSEETKMRQEDLSRLLYEVQILRSQQENMECQVQDMKQWVESYSGCFLRAFVSPEWWNVGNGWKEEPCTLPSPGSQGLTIDLFRQ